MYISCFFNQMERPEKMSIVCFLALFLCVAGSPRIQSPYVCHTWENKENGKDYCCVQNCDINQEKPSWCYVKNLQNHATYCSPPDTDTYKGLFDRYLFLSALHPSLWSWSIVRTPHTQHVPCASCCQAISLNPPKRSGTTALNIRS